MISARGLRDADGLVGQGSSDPYCTCEIIGKKDTKVRTQVIYNNLSPTWEHTAVVPKYMLGDRLRFRVWDKDAFSKDDDLGHAELELDAADVLPSFEGELRLEDAGAGIEAFLNLRVAVGFESERTKHSEVYRAREMLRAACQTGGVAALEEAIVAAKRCGLAPSEFRSAERRLEEERVREAARVFLQKAMQQYEAARERGGDSEWPEALVAALQHAEACGLDAESCREPAELLERARAARRLLARAEEDCDEPALQRAVQAAKDRFPPPVSPGRGALGREGEAAAEAGERAGAAAPPVRLGRRPGAGGRAAGGEGRRGAGQRPGGAPGDPGAEQAEGGEGAGGGHGRGHAPTGEQSDREGKESLDLEVAIRVKDRLAKAMANIQRFGWTIADLVEHDRVRKRIHNLVEDLKGSIRVYCRVRPMSEKEKTEGSQGCVRQVDLITVEVVSGHRRLNGEEPPDVSTHSYDAVFMPGTQEDIFADCKELVQSVLDGYNVTVFAYGQTGGGKTHTMIGVPGSPDLEGIVPRTINELFAKMKANEEHWTYELKAAVMELYCSQLVDLLPAPRPTSPRGKPKDESIWIPDKDKVQPLGIREVQGKFVVPDLAWHECPTKERTHEIFELGQAQRKTALTAMNAESSRSHLLFSIQISGRSETFKQQLSSKIILCDLAGSERLKKSKATGEREKEAIEINKSLSALGGVIDRLTSSSGMAHVPYRDHQLTQVLQDSLGGTAKTLMFLNCSPADSNWDETLNTLRYGTRAKRVTNNIQRAGEPRSPKAARSPRGLQALESPQAEAPPEQRLALGHATAQPSPAQAAPDAAAPPAAAQAPPAPGGAPPALAPLAQLASLEEALLGRPKQGALLPRIAETRSSASADLAPLLTGCASSWSLQVSLPEERAPALYDTGSALSSRGLRGAVAPATLFDFECLRNLSACSVPDGLPPFVGPGNAAAHLGAAGRFRAPRAARAATAPQARFSARLPGRARRQLQLGCACPQGALASRWRPGPETRASPLPASLDEAGRGGRDAMLLCELGRGLP
ncbi:unnamed protein product [Prorocentrum cordatum]|uniref:Kinesin-like protein n=1 Tax=Prorocentrum cordatum TaxID=2364126 RepID=A0ABN9Y7T3_9DINO|nr:unnamed protein product [Polarella glacialis]